MSITGHLEVLAGDDPAAGIDDRRGQRLLLRIDPDDIARQVGRDQEVRPSRTALGCSSHHLTFLERYLVGGPADNTPVSAPKGGKRSFRPILENTNRGRHFVRKTPLVGSQIALEPSLGSAFDPTRPVARVGHPRFNTGKALPSDGRYRSRSRWRPNGAARRRRARCAGLLGVAGRACRSMAMAVVVGSGSGLVSTAALFDDVCCSRRTFVGFDVGGGWSSL